MSEPRLRTIFDLADEMTLLIAQGVCYKSSTGDVMFDASQYSRLVPSPLPCSFDFVCWKSQAFSPYLSSCVSLGSFGCGSVGLTPQTRPIFEHAVAAFSGCS